MLHIFFCQLFNGIIFQSLLSTLLFGSIGPQLDRYNHTNNTSVAPTQDDTQIKKWSKFWVHSAISISITKRKDQLILLHLYLWNRGELDGVEDYKHTKL